MILFTDIFKKGKRKYGFKHKAARDEIKQHIIFVATDELIHHKSLGYERG